MHALKAAHLIVLLSLVATGCASNPRNAGPKIYVLTDLEGASGVYRFAQTREKGTPDNLKACEYLMGDLAAVVRGFRDAGASEIVIVDGHGNQAFVPELAQAGAKYITGIPRPDVMYGLDDSFDGIAMIGMHAMMGTPDGVLNHTQSSRGENRYWYNGVESGEIAQTAIIAAAYNVPPIMVSGDEATCREARQFLCPDCVTVATKRAVNRESVVLYPFSETCEALYQGAKQAVAAIPKCKPYNVQIPIQARKQWSVLENNKPVRQETKEGTIEDPLKLLSF